MISLDIIYDIIGYYVKDVWVSLTFCFVFIGFFLFDIEILVLCQHKIIIYIYISWNVVFIIVMFFLSHINSHFIYLFPTISLFILTLLLLINFVPCCYTFSNLPSFYLFHFSTTLKFNITLLLSFHLSFI